MNGKPVNEKVPVIPRVLAAIRMANISYPHFDWMVRNV
jgi:hypothetical protein